MMAGLWEPPKRNCCEAVGQESSSMKTILNSFYYQVVRGY